MLTRDKNVKSTAFTLSTKARPDTDFRWDQTAQVRSQSGVEINQSPQRKFAGHSLTSSLISPYSLFISELAKSEVIFVHQNLLSNWPGELTSFGFSDRLVEKLGLLHFLADLWSRSEFRTQLNSQRKTNPKSEMIHCPGIISRASSSRADLYQIFQEYGKWVALEKLRFWFLDVFGCAKRFNFKKVTFASLNAAWRQNRFTGLIEKIQLVFAW